MYPSRLRNSLVYSPWCFHVVGICLYPPPPSPDLTPISTSTGYIVRQIQLSRSVTGYPSPDYTLYPTSCGSRVVHVGGRGCRENNVCVNVGVFRQRTILFWTVPYPELSVTETHTWCLSYQNVLGTTQVMMFVKYYDLLNLFE